MHRDYGCTVGLLILLALVAAPANGTQVNGGMLIATSTSSLGFYGGQPAYLTAGLISVNNPGSTLVVQAGSSPGEFQASDVSSVLTNVAFGPGTVFGIQVVTGESFTYGSGYQAIPGPSSDASMGFLKLGNGTLTFSESNAYRGTTTISAVRWPSTARSSAR